MSAFPSQLEQTVLDFYDLHWGQVLDFYDLLGTGETQWKKSWLLAQGTGNQESS